MTTHPTLTDGLLAPEPLERADTIPSAWYTDAFFHTFDQHAVFASTWQYAGAASRLTTPGDYLTATVGRSSAIVVQQQSGTPQAFYNVCKHRGGPLAMDACGSSRMLQCKYHGWTYRLDGSLRGVPRFNRTELFDKRDFGLTPLETSDWEGLLFVRAEGGGPALSSAMKGIAERIHPMRLTDMRFYQRITYDIACNWKVYVDNFLEGYHLPLVHPELCDAIDYSGYVTETAAHYSLQHSPMLGASAYGNAQSAGGNAWYYFVFPNFMMNILPGRMQTNIVLPLAPDRCRVLFDYYYPAEEMRDDPDGLAVRAGADHDFSHRVQLEDIEICEFVQRGLESPAYDRGRFSAETEAGVHHFQDLLKAAYRSRLSRHGQ